jgi:chemotaxis protein methyltransferase CheR
LSVLSGSAWSGRRQRESADLVRDPAPGGHWDLVLCRNVAIYLDAAAKARLHRTLAGVLPAGGVLMVGSSERLSDPAALGLRRIEPHVYQRPR